MIYDRKDYKEIKNYKEITPQMVRDLKLVIGSGVSKGYCGRQFGYYGQSGCCAVTKILDGSKKSMHKGKYYRFIKLLEEEMRRTGKSKRL